MIRINFRTPRTPATVTHLLSCPQHHDKDQQVGHGRWGIGNDKAYARNRSLTHPTRLLFLAFLLFITAAPFCDADEQGLIASYHFDEGQGDLASDSSSNRNDGRINGAAWVKLPQGFALKFDGLDDFVNCSTFDLQGPITLAAWVCPAGAQTANEPGIIGKGFGSCLLTFYLNRKLYGYINSGGNNVCATVLPEIWSHVAFTFDGDKMTIYLNGELAAEKKTDQRKINKGGDFLIGSVLGDPSSGDTNTQSNAPFKGMIDAAMVYDHALSSDEIRQLFKNSDSNRNAMLKADYLPITEGITLRQDGCSATVGDSGALSVQVGNSACVFESRYSYPGKAIGFNALSATSIGEDNGWRPRVKRSLFNGISVHAGCDYYSLKRIVRTRNGRIEIEDTLENLTDKPVGVLIAHTLTTPELMTSIRVMATAENPTLFFSQSEGDFGLIAEDDISRLQFECSCIANVGRLGHSHFSLDARGKHTFRYAIYPFPPKGDWFSFINRVRKDWKVNFTIAGPWDYFDVYGNASLLQNKDALREYIARKNLRIIALMPWLEYDPGVMDHVIPRDEFKALMVPAAKAIHEIDPKIEVIGCIETDWVTLYPDKIKDGNVLFTGASAEVTKILDSQEHPWKDCVKRNREGMLNLERYTRGGKPQIALAVYPAPGNAQDGFLLDQARFLMDDVGLDGFYIDEFNQAWNQGIRSYSGWDGVSVDINTDTGEIVDKYTNCSLVGIRSRQEIIKSALSRGKRIVANTYSSSAREQSLPAQRFSEIQSYLDISALTPGVKPPLVYEMFIGALGSPIGLGATASSGQPDLAKGLTLAVISYLRHGLLYYHYAYPPLPETGPGSGEYGPINHLFPFTPVGLHEGWLEGKERTITCVSGKYQWSHKRKPNVLLFGLDGREKPQDFSISKCKGGWSVDARLCDWAEICIIE